MASCPSYVVTLPLPTSVNATHTVGKGIFNPKTKKWSRVVPRSAEYQEWLALAFNAFCKQYPMGASRKFEGRLRADYIFIWNAADRGRDSSDISNREKVLSDFLEKKFFLNDNQIDEQHHYRRFDKDGPNRVICRIYEIPDRRFEPFQ